MSVVSWGRIPFRWRTAVKTLARSDLAEAERFARSLNRYVRPTALAEVANAVAELDPGHAQALLIEAELMAHAVRARSDRVVALIWVASASEQLDPARAQVLLIEAERIIETELILRDSKTRALTELAKTVAKFDPAKAERLARSITDPDNSAEALAEVVRAFAKGC